MDSQTQFSTYKGSQNSFNSHNLAQITPKRDESYFGQLRKELQMFFVSSAALSVEDVWAVRKINSNLSH